MEHQSQNSSESIIIGNCLSCRGLVRVPGTASAKSKVRCPHCSATYPIVQILDQSVPQLELVEEADDAIDVPRVDQILINTNTDEDEKQKFVVPPQLSKGARRPGRRRSKESGNSPSGSVEPENSGAPTTHSDRGTSSSNRARSRNRASANARRHPRERNTVIELLKVVIGGVLAIPIAYLLVLWFFKQDPLNVGPKLGNVAPFLVPEEFHGNPNSASEDTLDDPGKENGTDNQGGDKPNDSQIMDVDPDRIKPKAPE